MGRGFDWRGSGVKGKFCISLVVTARLSSHKPWRGGRGRGQSWDAAVLSARDSFTPGGAVVTSFMPSG